MDFTVKKKPCYMCSYNGNFCNYTFRIDGGCQQLCYNCLHEKHCTEPEKYTHKCNGKYAPRNYNGFNRSKIV